MPLVLLIDDSEADRYAVGRRLTRLGYSVVEAGDGAGGVAAAAARRPDVILLDVAMPEVDGWETLDLLKADPATAGVPVIVLTALVHPGDRERAAAADHSGYHLKPVDFPKLVGQIEALLPPARPRSGHDGGPAGNSTASNQ